MTMVESNIYNAKITELDELWLQDNERLIDITASNGSLEPLLLSLAKGIELEDSIRVHSVLLKMLIGLQFFLITSSFYHLSLMGLMRYHAIRKPIHYTRLSNSRLFCYILLCWLSGIPLVIVFLMDPSDQSQHSKAYGVIE